jgi:hypothetical protein
MLHASKVGEPLIRTDVYISAEQRDTEATDHVYSSR